MAKHHKGNRVASKSFQDPSSLKTMAMCTAMTLLSRPQPIHRAGENIEVDSLQDLDVDGMSHQRNIH